MPLPNMTEENKPFTKETVQQAACIFLMIKARGESHAILQPVLPIWLPGNSEFAVRIWQFP